MSSGSLVSEKSSANADAAQSLREREFSRILLIKPSALGDVVHTIPVLPKLRRRYPRARIDWLITPENAEIVRCHPALSNVVLFARRDFSRAGKRRKAVSGFFNLLRKLREARYDLVIDLHGQMRSAFFALTTGAPVRIGFDRPVKPAQSISDEHQLSNTPRHGWRGAREGSWIAYTHRIEIPTLDVHAIDRYLWLAPILGLDDAPPEMEIFLPPDSEKNVERILRENHVLDDQSPAKPLAVLVPGTMWETKHWTISGFSAVAVELLREGFSVVLVGTMHDKPRCEAIATAAPGAVDLSGKTTPADLAALIRRADLCVTNDSGSMHLAAALRRPMVSIFGPTNPVHIGPYGAPESVVRLDLPCSPCNFRRLSQCPFDHACMQQLPPAMVIERVHQILAARSF